MATNNALQIELDQSRRTLERQERTLKVTMDVIDSIKSPDGTAPARIVNKRNRQYNAVEQTKTYIARVEAALGGKKNK